jgi:hypothetical protein
MQPTYYALRYRVPPGLGNPKPVPGRFNVYELRDGESTLLFDISNRTPDLFNQLLKRGIPEGEARKVFYEITA